MARSCTAASSDRVAARNAATDIAEAMLALRERIVWDVPPHRALQCHPTLNVGVTAQAGVYYGVLPGEAAFGCDLRTVPGMTEHAVHEALERWRTTAQTAGGRAIDLDIVYQPELSWIPSSEIATDHPLVRAAQQASEAVLGQSISLSVFPGATDAPRYDAQGIPTIPSLGPGILTYCHHREQPGSPSRGAETGWQRRRLWNHDLFAGEVAEGVCSIRRKDSFGRASAAGETWSSCPATVDKLR